MLNFRYPGVFGNIITALQPLMDVWGVLFNAIGPAECFGVQGFASKWVLRVVGLPAVLGAVVGVYYAYDRRNNGAPRAANNLSGNLFLAVFFCYRLG